MARASKLACFGMAMGIALAPAAAEAQTPNPASAVEVGGSGEARPSKTHLALKNAIDSYRKGEHEAAAGFFQQAKAGQTDLSASERQDLETWQQLNNTALQARREGSNRLQKAEAAVKAGKTGEALEHLKTVGTSQAFLTAAEKQKLQQLSEQLRPAAATAKTVGSPNATVARTKIQQARVLLAKGNYDAAHALATEAEQLAVPYGAGEDTPKKVMEDIVKARTVVLPSTDAKGYLTAARSALDKGDLDVAEHLAKEAEKKGSSTWSSLRLWGDSPAKVMRDVQVARARQAKSGKTTQVVDAKASPSTEAARQLLKDARKAQQDGDMAKARTLASQAKSLKPDLTWWDDSPDKVLADAEKSLGKKEVVLQNVPSDPHAQIKMARDLLGSGKFEEAERLAQMANTSKAHWGLFDDSPEKVLTEVRKQRAKHDHEESIRVLAEARKMFDKANGDVVMLEEAERLAYKAERMHGPYSMLEMGDRPQKLRAEIETARTKSRKSSMPPAPASMLAQRTPEPAKVAPITPAVAQVSASTTDKAPAAPPVVTTNSVPVVPAPVLPSLEKGAAQVKPATPNMPNLPTLSSGNSKPAAQTLLTDARQLQKEGRLIEARQKAVEAQKCNATFTGDEDRPEMALLAIASLAEKRVESLMQQAHEIASAAGGDASRCAKAEAALMQAKLMAEAFGFDVQPIQAKMAWVKQQNGPTVGSTATVPTTPVVAATTSGNTKERGEALLNQARLELRRGETGNARRFAEEAFTGPYGVQPDAEKVLRSIDVEEFNQKVLACQRSFDAGVAAYNRKDYAQSATILRGIDKQMLPGDKQNRLKELMLTPELQPHTVAQTSLKSDGPGRATATDQAPAAAPVETSLVNQVKAMQQIKVQQLREESIRSRQEATARFNAGETDKALEILRDFNAKLRESQLEKEDADRLRRPVEIELQRFGQLKSRRDFEKLQADQQESKVSSKQRQFLAEDNKNKQVAELMKQFNTFFKEGKYKEAEMYAMRAKELDPDNPIPGAAVYTARIQANQADSNATKRRSQKQVINAIDDAMDVGPDVNSDHPVSVDPQVAAVSKGRRSTEMINLGTRTEKERKIESKLQDPISLNFSDTPLRQVIDDLRDWTGLNIVPDDPALAEESVNLDKPITMKLENVSLKSALNLLLHQVHLTYVIKDEVLQVTTEGHARGKLQARTFNVADLVVPVENSTMGNVSLLKAMSQSPGEQANLRTSGSTPFLGANAMQGGSTVSSSQSAMANATPGSNNGVTKESARGTMEELLIKLITNTIAPQSWSNVGGPGTIEYYPLGMALIINQTPDIQEQIADLLAALRRLQDQEVSVEVKFITIAESFYERIGLDFNVNLKTDRYTTKYEPQIVSQQFKPFGFVNDFNPKNLIVGLTPGGTFTQDLDIPIRSSSFAQAIPPFGGFPNIPGANGGLELGLAFLSDIQVFLFMEAAQGDQRTNVMQAPKLTLFNGQTATINITDQQFFVTSVTVLQSGGQVVFVPNNNLLPTGGVSLVIQAVISADRRFVRLNLQPTITNIASAVIQLFPITTFITPVFEGGAVGQPIPFTQFLQQPVFNTITVQTTVAVPDGGTVLLGGLKRLSEGRNEFGPPILSKIPYINRLFKNVGYGREAENLLMMVTPRIIINEEEELKQTGVDRNLPVGALPQ